MYAQQTQYAYFEDSISVSLPFILSDNLSPYKRWSLLEEKKTQTNNVKHVSKQNDNGNFQNLFNKCMAFNASIHSKH